MEHPAPTPTTTPSGPTVAPIADGIVGASIGMGFFSMIVFWWYPFSPILSSVGLVLGSISLARGVKGSRGENFALGGTALCATSLSISFTLNHVLRYLQWDMLW